MNATPERLLNLAGWLIAITFVVVWYLKPPAKPELIGDLTPDQENELRADLVTAQGYADSLYRELEKSKAKGIEAAQSFKREITGQRKEIARLKANPTVIQFVQENPVLDSLHQAYDSALTTYENRVLSLTNELQLRDKINNQLRENFDKRISAVEGLLMDKEAEVTDLQKDNKKLRRKLLMTKIGGVIIIGGILALSL